MAATANIGTYDNTDSVTFYSDRDGSNDPVTSGGGDDLVFNDDGLVALDTTDDGTAAQQNHTPDGQDPEDDEDVTVNEAQPDVSLDLVGSPLAEDGGSATVTASSSDTGTQDVNLHLGFGGSADGGGVDNTASDTSITVAAGSLANGLTVTAANDNLHEGDEEVIIAITGVINGREDGTQRVTATIIDAESLFCVDDSLFQGVAYTTNYFCNAATRIRAGNGTVVNSGFEMIYRVPLLELFSGFRVMRGGPFRLGQDLPPLSPPRQRIAGRSVVEN